MRNLFSNFLNSTKETLVVFSVFVMLSCSESDDNDDAKWQSLQDIEGNEYVAVAIGSQVWMADNLEVTKYNDGTDIPYVTDADDIASLTTGAFTYYNEDASNSEAYGALYNWFAVSSGKLCPMGWHAPTDAEWTTLINFLGGEGVAGGHLKELGTTHWNAPNTGATNDSGFTAVPGGYLYDTNKYQSLGNVGHWWTSTESAPGTAWDRYLYFQNATATKGEYNKQVFYSCRCVKN